MRDRFLSKPDIFLRRSLRQTCSIKMSIDELASAGSPQCKEAFAFLREQLKADPNVEETVEYEPLKESEAPSYNVRETPRR